MTLQSILIGARGLTQPPQNNGAPLESKMGAAFGWDQRPFYTGQERQVDIGLRVPSSWDKGVVSFVIRCRTASTANDAIFELHYEVLSVGDNLATINTPVLFDAQKTITVPAVADTEFEISWTDTPVVSPGQMLRFRLKRLGTLPGDNTGDVYVTEAWFELGRTPSLSGVTSVAATGAITDVQFRNKLVEGNTSGASVDITLPALAATDDLTWCWVVRKGGNLLRLVVPGGGYSFVYSGGSTSPYSMSNDGDMVLVLYRHANKTFYIK